MIHAAIDGWGIILLHMSKRQKILKKILAGSRNITFDDFLLVVEGFGFHLSRVMEVIIFSCIQRSENW